MGASAYLHSVVVVGSGYFPVDMLRYDHCWPADTESAMEVVNRDRDDLKGSRKVRVLCLDRKGWKPTVDRWRSFGWDVKEHTSFKVWSGMVFNDLPKEGK